MYKLILCLRYLTTRRIAMFSIVSVMLGVATMIVVNSVMGGFRDKMRQRLHGILADVIVESTSLDGFPNPQGVMDHIEKVAGDKIVAMTPVIEIFGLMHYQNLGRGQHFTRQVMIVGIDPAGRDRVGEFSGYLENPINKETPSFSMRDDALRWREENVDLLNPDYPAQNGAIVGFQIATFRGRGMEADQYLIQPGNEIILTTVCAGKPKPIDDRFVVTDLFKSEMSEYDGNRVFVPYQRLQEIRNMGDSATSIQIKLSDYRDAPEVIAKLQESLPRAYFFVQSWEDKQGPLLQAVKVEAAILNFILFFIIAVAGFGILAIFFMIVVEKTRDIGILKSLGASDYGIMSIFLSYGLVLGLVGCLLGSILGITLSININPIEETLTRWTGVELFPRDIYYFKEIPSMLDPWVVVWVNLGSLLIAVGAAVLPAIRASRLNPVESLRYE